MFTLFHIFALVVSIGAGIGGFRIGHGIGGIPGGLLGAVGGVCLGWIVGSLPFTIPYALLRRSIKRASIPVLMARLDREPFMSHLVIAELVVRGEPVESFRNVVIAQLSSASPDLQQYGRANAKLWFPDLVEQRDAD